MRAPSVLELVHSNICEPIKVKARHGTYYFITFIDDYSQYGFVYLVSHKSEPYDCFRRFLNLVENQKDKTLKILRKDRSREYLSHSFKELCENKCIIRQLRIPGTLEQNHVAETRYCT